MRQVMFGLLASLVMATSALADCEPLTLAASLPATRDAAGGVVVPASFDGHDIQLLIDTAGIFSLMSDATVTQFNLERRALPATIFVGASGNRLNESVAVHQFRLGNLVANRMEFVVMPAKMVAKGVDGTLGPTVMSSYDMEIDLLHGKVNLFSKHHCTGEVVYWTNAPHAEIPMRVDTALHIIIPVTLDGKTMNAVVDTGSSTSWMDYDDAARIFDWSDAGPPGLTHLGGESSEWWAYPFAALSLNGVDVRNPQILLKKHSENLAGGPPLIIGMDVLGKLHTFFSYADHTLYITAPDAPPPDAPPGH
jgi:predicted aspartyl protease